MFFDKFVRKGSAGGVLFLELYVTFWMFLKNASWLSCCVNALWAI